MRAISAPPSACAATKMPRCSAPETGPSRVCMPSATNCIPGWAASIRRPGSHSDRPCLLAGLRRATSPANPLDTRRQHENPLFAHLALCPQMPGDGPGARFERAHRAAAVPGPPDPARPRDHCPQPAGQGADLLHRRWPGALRQPGDLRVSERPGRGRAVPGPRAGAVGGGDAAGAGGVWWWYGGGGGGGGVWPAPGAGRWAALTLQARGDGMLDAALLARYEDAARPEPLRWEDWKTAHLDKIETALAALDAAPGQLTGAAGRADIGSIAVGCALWYLDLRFAALGWRDRYRQVGAWYAGYGQRPAMQARWSL